MARTKRLEPHPRRLDVREGEAMIRITIPGRPVPKARPRLGVRGRTAYIYTPENTRAYEQLVGMCARAATPAPLQGPVEMQAFVYLRHGRRGDLDNYLKCICDGLNKIAWRDDSQVVRGRWRTWEEQFPDRTTRKKNNLGVFCSVCQLHADNMTSYCPNCGAKMESEGNT